MAAKGKKKAKKGKKKSGHLPRIVNRKARYDYFVLEYVEAGMVLLGTEIKSIRNGKVSLDEGFARIKGDNEVFLYGVDIALYEQAGPRNHVPTRPRKLLMHKREISKLAQPNHFGNIAVRSETTPVAPMKTAMVTANPCPKI